MQRPVNGRGDELCCIVSASRYFAPAARSVVMLLLLNLFPLASVAQDGRSYLDLSGGYKTGDFGTPTKSELYYVSPTLGYVAPLYDVSAAFPYLFLTNRIGGASGSESGIGDIIVRGGRVLLPEGDAGFFVDGALAVKLPTADKNKGLGTGETDYGAFLSVHQRFDKTKISLMTGYIKVGDPPAVNYNDIYLYGMGISQEIGSTELFASLDGRRRAVPGAQNPQEVSAGFFHVLNTDYAIRGSAFKGLNNGGPDFGMNIGVIRWF